MSGLRNGKAIKFKPLTEQKIASILRNYRINPLGMSSEEEDFRISIAGAQEKSAFLYHEKQWCEPLQETPTTHIFKLPIGYIPHHGGPGIKDIMQLLLGSAKSLEDRDMFFRTQILFWLLAGIDGHAKNFSLFIEPEGKYRLTPLYDIMSAYPLIQAKQLQSQKIKMAMALQGKNKHYHWHTMQRRHFIETAKAVNYSQDRAESILEEILKKTDFVINEVSKLIPEGFPAYICDPIFQGIMKAKQN